MSEGFLFVPEVADLGERCKNCPGFACSSLLDQILMIQQARNRERAEGITVSGFDSDGMQRQQFELGCTFNREEILKLWAVVSGDEHARKTANHVLGSKLTGEDS